MEEITQMTFNETLMKSLLSSFHLMGKWMLGREEQLCIEKPVNYGSSLNRIDLEYIPDLNDQDIDSIPIVTEAKFTRDH
jgi:hypothetical protein